MAYGPLCQCAFMSYGPRIQQKAPMKKENRVLWDKLPDFEAPPGCEAPPPGAFTLYTLDIAEKKENPEQPDRSLELDGKCFVLGSSQTYDGMVYDGHKSVAEQHAYIYFKKGKWFLKGINGTSHLESMTLHSYLRDSDGKAPRRYISTGTRKIDSITPMDGKRQFSREMCCFRLGDSDRRFWISGTLPLKEGEVEEGGVKEDRRGDRKRDRDEKEPKKSRRDDRDDRNNRGKERDRSRSANRSRSRSDKRRRR